MTPDFCSAPAFPLAAVRSLPNVALLLTAHGGHIAFLQGLFPRGESYMDRLLGQFVEAVFEHPGEVNRACGVKQLETQHTKNTELQIQNC